MRVAARRSGKFADEPYVAFAMHARFLEPDPLGLAQGPNLYEYALDDPLDHSDPTGLLTEEQEKFHQVVYNLDKENSWLAVPALAPAAAVLAAEVVEAGVARIGAVTLAKLFENRTPKASELVRYA